MGTLFKLIPLIASLEYRIVVLRLPSVLAVQATNGCSLLSPILVGRKSFDQRRQNILRQMPHELLDRPEGFLHRKHPRGDDAMVRFRKCAEAMAREFRFEGCGEVQFFSSDAYRGVSRQPTAAA